MSFVANLGVYRRAYESAAAAGHEDVARFRERGKAFEKLRP